MIELWNDTNRIFHEQAPKRLYYLSIEFLIGRLLRSNMLSLGLQNQYTQTLNQIGLHLEEIQEEELDMALGNGGLGRLAACYLDSMATLRLPAWGYGLRYQYGMFKQKISEHGDQLELPDYWLENGCPWEIQRNDVKYTVRFYGHVRKVKKTETKMVRRIIRRPIAPESPDHGFPSSHSFGTSSGPAPMLPHFGSAHANEGFEDVEVYQPVEVETDKEVSVWEGGEEVVARCYDVPIAGYRTYNMINLRLWESIPSHEFDLSSFNVGSYDQAVKAKQNAETITQVLYPNDSFTAGKELRLKQQYFFVSATLQDIIRRFENQKRPYKDLPSQVIMQCNDTHPVLAIPELLRILMDEKGLPFEEAWPIVQRCFAYTNHTVLPEALEKWPVDLLGRIIPRHLELIYLINYVWLEAVRKRYPQHLDKIGELSIIEEHPVKSVRMANLAIVTATKVNGVAALHSKLLTTTIFKAFYQIFPNRFLNVTNGVTPRRWLLESNPPLADLYTTVVGPRWPINYSILTEVEKHMDKSFIAKFWECKHIAKEKLAALIEDQCGISLPRGAELDRILFDVHVKRLHEYKRQSLNILRCIHEYLELKKLTPAECAARTPKLVIFGGKAAPGYFMAKKTIKLINSVANVVNADPSISGALRVVFLPNYNVSSAQVIIPAADISEQISTAGYEASGTSCMKFCMNGALLVGTWDGANIEIVEEIGREQAYLFGILTEEVADYRKRRSEPGYVLDPNVDTALTAIEAGMFGDAEQFGPFTSNIRENDHYLVCDDFAAFVRTHKQIERDWEDKDAWARRAILTSVRMGKFSSDRSIIEYSKAIWGITPCVVPSPIAESAVAQ